MNALGDDVRAPRLFVQKAARRIRDDRIDAVGEESPGAIDVVDRPSPNTGSLGVPTGDVIGASEALIDCIGIDRRPPERFEVGLGIDDRDDALTRRPAVQTMDEIGRQAADDPR